MTVMTPDLTTVYRLECDHCHTGPFMHNDYYLAPRCANRRPLTGPTTQVDVPTRDRILCKTFQEGRHLCAFGSLYPFARRYCADELARLGWSIRAIQVPTDQVTASYDDQVIFPHDAIVRTARVTEL